MSLMAAEEEISNLLEERDDAEKRGQLAFNGMCEFLEWHMATYEYIKDLKKTAKHELKRHEGMIKKGLMMLRVAGGDYKVPRSCVRVFEEMEKVKEGDGR